MYSNKDFINKGIIPYNLTLVLTSPFPNPWPKLKGLRKGDGKTGRAIASSVANISQEHICTLLAVMTTMQEII